MVWFLCASVMKELKLQEVLLPRIFSVTNRVTDFTLKNYNV